MSREEDFAKTFAENIMQQASYKLGDMLNEFPAGAHVFVLVIMHRLVDTILPLLPETDQKLFKHLVNHTQVAVAPSSLDPRKKEAEE